MSEKKQYRNGTLQKKIEIVLAGRERTGPHWGPPGELRAAPLPLRCWVPPDRTPGQDFRLRSHTPCPAYLQYRLWERSAPGLVHDHPYRTLILRQPLNPALGWRDASYISN